jgi:hypothetical protein
MAAKRGYGLSNASALLVAHEQVARSADFTTEHLPFAAARIGIVAKSG